MSQAEHTGLFFEAANGTKFIGSQTAGAAQLMQVCAANGMQNLDHSALVKALELMADHPVMPDPKA